MHNTVGRVQPGDVLLCYLTGVMRWVGAIEVVGPSDDRTRIWADVEFPERLSVKPLVILDAEQGVPMDALIGQVEFFESDADRGKYKGFVRRSPNLFRTAQDGELILSLLREAEANPVHRPVDAAKLARKPLFKAEKRKGRNAVEALVSVPETDESHAVPGEYEEAKAPTAHTEIQHRLLRLGNEIGLDVWVAKNDRSRTCRGEMLGSVPGMVDEMPAQFNEATNRTIELIDVLWLKGNSIVAAFEIECTTAIYSGLLRMSDLLALQPNLNIDLFIVAPDERKEKVEQEILRPTFGLREPPLADVCGFLSIQELTDKIDAVARLGLTSSLKPDFVKQMAVYFGDEE